MSLSMPRGPSVVRTVSAIAWQALMLEMSWPRPWDVSVPSRRRMICGCIIMVAAGLGRATVGPRAERRGGGPAQQQQQQQQQQQ